MNVYLPGREMPQSWPGSSGGLAPKRGPSNFDRERPHCLLRSSAIMDVASNWEQNSALEMFSDGGWPPAAPLYFLLFLFIHLLICGRLLMQPLCFIYLFTLFIHLFSYLWLSPPIDKAAPLYCGRITGRAAASAGGRSGICPHCPMAKVKALQLAMCLADEALSCLLLLSPEDRGGLCCPSGGR